MGALTEFEAFKKGTVEHCAVEISSSEWLINYRDRRKEQNLQIIYFIESADMSVAPSGSRKQYDNEDIENFLQFGRRPINCYNTI